MQNINSCPGCLGLGDPRMPLAREAPVLLVFGRLHNLVFLWKKGCNLFAILLSVSGTLEKVTGWLERTIRGAKFQCHKRLSIGILLLLQCTAYCAAHCTLTVHWKLLIRILSGPNFLISGPTLNTWTKNIRHVALYYLEPHRQNEKST